MLPKQARSTSGGQLVAGRIITTSVRSPRNHAHAISPCGTLVAQSPKAGKPQTRLRIPSTEDFQHDFQYCLVTERFHFGTSLAPFGDSFTTLGGALDISLNTSLGTLAREQFRPCAPIPHHGSVTITGNVSVLYPSPI